MDMLRLTGFGVSAALMALLLRRLKPELGLAASLAAGVLLCVLVLPHLAQLLQGRESIARAGGLADGYMAQLLKVCGVSLLTDFAAQTCRDAGEDGLALKVELAGRVMLIALALPVMEALLSHILSLSF